MKRSPNHGSTAFSMEACVKAVSQSPVFWSLIAYLLGSLVIGTMGWFYARHFFIWAATGGIISVALVQLVWWLLVLLKHPNDM